jgi:RimJ/RimL family protein N-acetyltransferase
VAWADLAATPLENDHVRLTPVAPEDREALRAIAMDRDIWHHYVYLIETDADFEALFDADIADLATSRRVPYVITEKSRGQVAGSMSIGNMAERDGRLEIGWSWLGLAFQGKGINRWAKFLMMEHAFEKLGAERVEFKTDKLNVQARRGLRNIGAVEEGTLRSFNPMPGGRRRDAVYYSVLRSEWSSVRERLSGRPKAAPAP